MTHLAAGFGGVLLTLLSLAKRIRINRKEEQFMANKFVSILKDVGKGLLFVFTNKTAEAIEAGGLNLAVLIWPGLTPLFTALSNAIAKAQAQAAVSIAGLTQEQIIALVLADAQADFQTAGITENARQQAIVAAAIALIDEIPSGSVNAAVVTAAVNQVSASPAPAAPAPAPAAQPAAATAAAAQSADEARLEVPA